MGIVKILSIITLLLIPFGEVVRWDVGNNMVIKPLDMAIGITALLGSILYLIKKKKISDLPFVKPISFFVAVAIFALLLNSYWLKPQEMFVASLYILRWIAYAIFFWLVYQFDGKFKKKLLNVLFLSGVLSVLFGFLQFFFYPKLRNLYYLGWDDHMYRMFTSFLDPNFGGAIFVLFFLLTGGFIFANLKKKKKKTLLLLGFVSLSTLLAVLLTYSRSALLMLIVSTIVFLVLIRRKKVILMLLAVLALYVIISIPKFYIENLNLFRTSSSDARLYNYSVALQIFAKRPVLGVGFDSYRYAKKYFKFPEGWVKTPSHADAGVDNSFLFVLATTGVVGFGAYIYFWFTVLKSSYRTYQQEKNVLEVVCMASIIGLFTSSLFINSLFYAHIMVWMWTILGIMKSKLL